MARSLIAALTLIFGAALSAQAAEVSAEAKAGVEKTLAEMGCTMDVDDDVEAAGDGYKAEDVECKDGQYDMTFDKDFKVTNKKKED